ncbi:MAG: hypothetical protein K0R57_5060 [Paenibacillaceae bacterium]|jgi:multimeric flavodoxin WrbA|nr:hypothetical protein [Paenibacillaceae bacterium]
MRIAVVNGSPKGEMSVTMQYVKYMEKKFSQHEFVYLHVAHSIRRLERDEDEFNKVIETVRSADAVLWGFPLYVYLVHGSYKRFVELIWERGVQDAFKDKYAALLATSIHFFDHTALSYMHAVCDDLEMRYTEAYSADMDDLMKESERQRLLAFAENVFGAVSRGSSALRTYHPVDYTPRQYTPAPVDEPIDTRGQRVVIVVESADQAHNTGRMAERFRKLTRGDVIDLSLLRIKGGCTGCIHCGFDNECIYGDRDDIERTYRAISQYDVIVFAAAVRDRYLSARWKTFVDRRFFITHQPHFVGKQIAYLISGPLSQLHNLQEVLQANTELERANLAGFLSDEYASSAEIDERMEVLAERLIDCSVKRYVQPRTFLGIGGMKIFRDDVWGRLRFVFQGDHRYYKKNGYYDFPHKQYGTRIANLFMVLLTKIPPVKKSIQQNMKSHMISSLQKVVKEK